MAQAILCIDDDRQVLGDLKAGLDCDDRHLIHESDPEEALRVVRERAPDLVVIEIRLAGGDGLDWVERVRTDRDVDPTLPILVVTSATRTPRLYGRAVQLGVEDYLTKPVPRAQLVEIVEQALSRERAMMLTDPIVEAPSGEELAKGSLSALPLPELLDRLHLRGATGVLIVEGDGRRTGIQLRNGSPTAVSQGFVQAFEDFLVHTGRITQQERDRARNELSLGLATLREILLGMELMDELEYEEALSEQADEQILRLFELTQGRFRFIARRQLKRARALEVTASVHSLIVRGLLARSPAESVRSALARVSELYPSVGLNLEDRFEDVPASPAQREFIAGLSGDRPVADFMELSEFEQRTLYTFSLLGVVKLSVDPVLSLDEVLVEEEPSPAEVEDVAPAEETLEAAAPAEDEAPEAQEQSAAVRALEAESWFRKGQGFMKRKDFAKAVEAFGMSSHLDPVQGEYVARLGYCLYLTNPGDELVRKEAMEHIARGIKLSPEQELSYIFLGRIFKVMGDAKIAEQMFHRALSIRPGCREAEQELRLMEMRREKSGGLLNKLWSR